MSYTHAEALAILAAAEQHNPYECDCAECDRYWLQVADQRES